MAAEKAALRVEGVKAVVQEIDVKISGSLQRTDEDIAQAALNHLKWNTSVPEEKIKLEVEEGWLTLAGKVNWNYQKEAAKNAVRYLTGVRGVTNLIEVKAAVEPKNVKDKIRNAFHRNATIDSEAVNVLVEGDKIILKGTVQSRAEKKQAENAAWSAPGVSKVENKLEIRCNSQDLT